MRPHPTLIISCLLVLLLSACAKATPVPTEQPVIEKYVASVTLTPERGALVGQAISSITDKPLTNTVVRLAKVFWNEDHSDGAYVLEGATSPSTITTDEGVFVFGSLEPADYVVIIGEVIGIHEIVSEPDGKARIFSITASQTLQIDALHVNLNQQ